MDRDQSYRASVAALIVNRKKEILLTQLIHAQNHKWDFVKGGMQMAEDHLDTLMREIHEELGAAVKFQVLEKSNVAIIYDWPKALQIQKGFRGQARISYWVLYEEGEIEIQSDELKAYQWVPYTQAADIMMHSHFSEPLTQCFMQEWENINQRLNIHSS